MGLYHECWLLGHIEKNKNGKYNKPSSRTLLYSKDGTKKGDRDGTNALTDQGMKYCLTYVRGKCSDFLNEKSEIEFLLEELSQMDTLQKIYIKLYFCPNIIVNLLKKELSILED